MAIGAVLGRDRNMPPNMLIGLPEDHLFERYVGLSCHVRTHGMVSLFYFYRRHVQQLASTLRRTTALNFRQMLTQAREHLLAISVIQLSLKLIESEVDDVMVMEWLGRDIIAELQPNAVQ